MKSNLIIVVAGHTGSGKSTLAKSLAAVIGSEEIGFSYAGRILSTIEKDTEEFLQIEGYVYSCITSAVKRPGQIVVDGLASEKIYDRLKGAGFTVKVIFLDTPERIRIKRIAKREKISIEEAVKIEDIKERGKAKSGLKYVISKADVTIDGKQNAVRVLKQAMRYYVSLHNDVMYDRLNM